MNQKPQNKQELEQRLKTVYTALARRNRWFTGISYQPNQKIIFYF
jgi:hypothetical protein